MTPAERAAESRASQGLPRLLTDPSIIDQVAAVLTQEQDHAQEMSPSAA